jgi:hypothetical protein
MLQVGATGIEQVRQESTAQKHTRHTLLMLARYICIPRIAGLNLGCGIGPTLRKIYRLLLQGRKVSQGDLASVSNDLLLWLQFDPEDGSVFSSGTLSSVWTMLLHILANSTVHSHRLENPKSKTRISGKNSSPAFLWYDTDRVGNCTFNNSSLSRERLYRDRSTDSPLIRHGPHTKWSIQQSFYCCMCSLSLERVYLAVA